MCTWHHRPRRVQVTDQGWWVEREGVYLASQALAYVGDGSGLVGGA